MKIAGWPVLAAFLVIAACSQKQPTRLSNALVSDSASLAHSASMPRYSNIFVIVEENKSYDQVMNKRYAPNLWRLARAFGSASAFYGEVHPSEADYVALLGGDTFGIHDDDAFYCKPQTQQAYCGGAQGAAYVDHTIAERHLGQQLEERGLKWKGYYSDLPEPGSLAVVSRQRTSGGKSYPASLYASKHSGFLNFAAVQADPRRAEHIVGFDQLDRDLLSNQLPNFALIVPNQCDEMHGLLGLGVPKDCSILASTSLIRRGDRVLGELVERLQRSRAWMSSDNMAIVITFDEGSGGSREGCCAVTPNATSNFGAGRIPTVVITNHGPRGVTDPTPYNHYSLLRTVEDAFGIAEHLRHAGDEHLGVYPMTPLFALHAPVEP